MFVDFNTLYIYISIVFFFRFRYNHIFTISWYIILNYKTFNYMDTFFIQKLHIALMNNKDTSSVTDILIIIIKLAT